VWCTFPIFQYSYGQLFWVRTVSGNGWCWLLQELGSQPLPVISVTEDVDGNVASGHEGGRPRAGGYTRFCQDLFLGGAGGGTRVVWKLNLSSFRIFLRFLSECGSEYLYIAATQSVFKSVLWK
jgi:hypothetical protein